ncbi:DUF4230 domain-containing protein [uncultured Alloprevotella sp.]|uniref:DUF4230 domain-containing protein n=1 Tax=uncultured Alloprevotella sp. TaxID=1283315 RepID=UPI002636C0CE|nr:DUF4230 domain-containing protein [uncultured Alloprevotella sp.]
MNKNKTRWFVLSLRDMNCMKYLLLASCFFLFACGKSGKTDEDNNKVKIDTTATIVNQIVRCSRLYTTEYKIHKLVTHSDVRRLEGKVLSVPVSLPLTVGDRKIAIPIDVTVKAYIDFSDFSAARIQRSGKGIVVTLPNPKVIVSSSKIDEKGIREYIDLTRSHYSSAEVAAFAKQGEDSIVQHLDQTDILKSAERSAAQVLLPMLHRMGYDESQVVIRFDKNPTPQNVESLITIER